MLSKIGEALETRLDALVNRQRRFKDVYSCNIFYSDLKGERY